MGLTAMSEMTLVPITQQELDTVKSRKGVREQCIAFALLAEAKRLTLEVPERNFWVNGEYRTGVIAKADLTIHEEEMALMIYRMKCDGLVGLARAIDNCSMHVLFTDPDGEAVMILDDNDFEHLGYCWRAHAGEPYTKCQRCGCWIKQEGRGKPRRFCKACAEANHKAVNRASMKRARQKSACVL